MFKNKGLIKIHEPKRDEETGKGRKLHDKKLHNLCSSLNFVTVLLFCSSIFQM
jgi:hypothetical protein